jgi:protein SCO1/2
MSPTKATNEEKGMVDRRQFFAKMAMAPLAGTLAGCGGWAKTSSSDTKQTEPAARRFAPRLSGRETLRQRSFPNLNLVTSEGRPVKFYDDLLKDKVVLLNFMYADCQGICPTIAANLKRVRKLLDAAVTMDIFIYSFTIQPEADTPAKLSQYAQMHGIHDSKWSFVTGKPDDMDTLRHLLGFADPNPAVDKDKTRHTGMLRYGNEPLSIWGSCQGNAAPEWIAQEIQFAVPREFKRHPRVNE